jgi:Zn-dependent peptidase ImmA (M78 family)/transcriptional regulator with XRE-family HTH domain
VLRWARLQAAASTAEVAKRAEVAENRVLAWENGTEMPSVAKLRAVAGFLRQPLALFFAPAPPHDNLHLPPDFRAAGLPVGRHLAREIRLAEERRDTYKHLEPGVVADPAWPKWRDVGLLNPGEIRARLGVGVADIASAKTASEALRIWITALESQGLLVFQMSGIGDEECSGFSIDDAVTPVIVLNGKDALQRRVFTLLHEVGHLLDHGGGLCALDESVDREQVCNRFAENVLMPEFDVRAAVHGLTGTEAVERVSKRFYVSRPAAAVTLRRRGLVDQDVVDYELRRSEEAWEQTKNQTGAPPPERLKRRNLGDVYLTAVLDALDREAISVTDATYFLAAKVGMIDKLERELAGSAP